jgi:hypothetical protein
MGTRSDTLSSEDTQESASSEDSQAALLLGGLLTLMGLWWATQVTLMLGWPAELGLAAILVLVATRVRLDRGNRALRYLVAAAAVVNLVAGSISLACA